MKQPTVPTSFPANQEHMVDTQTHARTHTHAHVHVERAGDTQTTETDWFSGLFLLCADTAQWVQSRLGNSEPLRSFTLTFSSCQLVPFTFFSFSIYLFFSSSINVAQVLSWPSLSWDVRPHLHQCLHTLNTWHRFTTGKALSQNRQENSGKPGYNLALMEPKRFPPGRWAPSYWEKPKDRQRKLHPGKCLCSAVGSLDFCPANEWLFVCS